ncbi:MAG: hypothetical protein LBH95_02085 [Oscillospiraceae bacterium]|jgi:hypothetical protein|nr:hypothetical protein [Oscillospiraceae bacterium]
MFYKLAQDKKYSDVWYNSKVKHFESVKCPKYSGHQRGIRNVQPLSAEIKKPDFGDFITTSYSDWLITDKVVDIFQSSNLTGYKRRLVDVCNMRLDFNLWEIIVTGSAGRAHPDTEIFIKRNCEYCGHIVYSPIKKGKGLIINEAHWDGSDFFTITEFSKFVLVTENAKKIIEENNLKGALFVPINELGWE